ncbi:MAG: hypothetical protein AVDCRST_MAG50-277 [uncultured Acidimicrobiales bacterium]|uniref:Phosphodiesterase n=1 Tax=uncultured Acidimicrobiales bacterium TaxID=310071 RepID=A0A6J4H772_9ACTN|nr:MAG: hypothetical protein AVDCRST_MAG50-277 [uncultured Acidimicrobiales bacterium]
MPDTRPHRSRPAGAATPLIEATAGAVSAVVFGMGSGLRRARVFHPTGVAFQATFVVSGGAHGAPLLDVPARHPAVVRLSRGVGLPERFPDILGLAVRLVDAHGPGRHQDLLVATSGSAPLLRHLLVPARSFDHGRMSALLPYAIGQRRVIFGARPLRAGGGPTTRLADLAGELGSGRLRFVIEAAEATGPWAEIGVLEVGAPLSSSDAESLRFNPANAGGGVEPVGALQAVRRLAYRGSQATRPTD